MSWQIVPEKMGELLSTPAAVQAMLKMGKLDLATLKAAAGAPAKKVAKKTRPATKPVSKKTRTRAVRSSARGR